MTDAFIFDSVRTPRGLGKKRGALHEVRAVSLLSSVLRALQQRNHLDTAEVDDGIFGCVTPVNDQGGNIGKSALLFADWDYSVSGMQINRFCCSGLSAVNIAAMKIGSGMENLVVAGGIESMSRVRMTSDRGPLLFDPDVVSKINYLPQGIAADLVATLNNFSREALDQCAYQSHQRAAHAQENNYFQNSIIPIKDQNNLLLLDRDENVRPDTTPDILAALAPSFALEGGYGFDAMAKKKYPEVERIHHLHTAGNSCAIVDAAAALLVGNEKTAVALNLKPRARVVSTSVVSCEPTIMFRGHVMAAKKVLQKTGLMVKDIDLWEVNEAFAAVALVFQKEMDIDPACVNVNGGAIAFGHPLGATGVILVGTVLDELERTGKKRALIAISGGGGMGVATIIERV